MLNFGRFTGVNNVLPTHRLSSKDLVRATDVDIGLTGEITRRQGFISVSEHCHKNHWEAAGYLLATVGGALTAIHPDGARLVIHPALGTSRVWYCNLPDGRTTFSNGNIHGVTDGHALKDWALPTPQGVFEAEDVPGQLFPGSYQYHLTYVRDADGMESSAVSGVPIQITQGGFRISGLLARAGYRTNLYLSGHNGEGALLAGSTAGDSIEYTGNNAALVLPCRTLGTSPMPVGTITAYWRGRLLVAHGKTLWASRPQSPHLVEWRDFRPMTHDITAILPVDDGVYVGTENDLVFLGGNTFDALTYTPALLGPVVLGSGVQAPGSKLRSGEGPGKGMAMVCIAGGEVVAGFGGGITFSLTGGRYRTTHTEVSATFRDLDGVPQYLAVPR